MSNLASRDFAREGGPSPVSDVAPPIDFAVIQHVMGSAFSNQIVLRLAARQFWLHGQLSSPCSPIFVETEDRRAWKIFYHDEHCRWAIAVSETGFPAVGTTTGDNEMQWIDAELDGGMALIGRRIIDFRSENLGEIATGTLIFEGQRALALSYSFETEQSHFVVEE